MKTAKKIPKRVAVVCAHGVFTSPLEWVALYAAAGCRVLVKAPSRAPAFAVALCEDLAAEGLPVEVQTDRALPARLDAVVAFGSDDGVRRVGAMLPDSRQALFGHRFSVAYVEGDLDRAQATAVARDAALYDTRGCMAPTAVFTTGDADRLAAALGTALADAAATLPAGSLDPAEALALRQRVGLARVKGGVREGRGWVVCTLPPALFAPLSLPRLLTVIPVGSGSEAAAVLDPWRPHLSTVGTNLAATDGAIVREPPFLLWFPRVCPLGRMQTPPFPRAHDGRPMLRAIVGDP